MNNKDEMVCSMSGVLFLENKCEYDLYKTTWKEKSQNIISHVNEVDMVLHAAAITNLNGDYETVSEVNITGTKEIIDFTLKTANKYLVFVSTHMIIGDKWYSESNLFYDEKMLNINQTFDGLGYQRSKYEAEIMVREATSKGLKWNIMRVGNVMGRSYDGAFPLNRGNCGSIPKFV